ncbi:putative RNase H-like nuclease [Leifsonia sp. AK011]|uniref:DUF429 domain-containing protein n=1 Tax=Leifsonia sp. AK011 TaxID=2723075 RepID=UPI0018028AF0|nr:DUF429 domain-containing protein [Leifsonia sp. AK011]NYF09818.1 putative RNase H-like nuclease [Leifsonia sp. AK011]
MPNYFGIDLAWGEGSAEKAAKETGVAMVREDGSVADVGWTTGIEETTRWIADRIGEGDTIAIDAPLVVVNPTGMRECEREVGQRYGRWKVAANSTNLTRAWLGGVTLRQSLEASGVQYDDGVHRPDPGATTMFECYPYTTLVGAHELGYEVERPRYKRPNTSLPSTERRSARAAVFDDLVSRMLALRDASVPLDLLSHASTADLSITLSPTTDRDYKHREDLLDALLCAWTAAVWAEEGLDRCQVLGALSEPDEAGRRATIIALARSEQRQSTRPKRILTVEDESASDLSRSVTVSRETDILLTEASNLMARSKSDIVEAAVVAYVDAHRNEISPPTRG